jgi:hypothetical protein
MNCWLHIIPWLLLGKTSIPILHHTTFPMAWLIFAFPHITILARQYTLVYPLKVVGWHILYCGCVCYTQIIPGYQIIGLINLGNIYPHVLDAILCYPTCLKLEDIRHPPFSDQSKAKTSTFWSQKSPTSVNPHWEISSGAEAALSQCPAETGAQWGVDECTECTRNHRKIEK